ncbi:helix-turn-helix transcriptional regulator [Niallia sp. NCCP-28]|uniref:substrate-binding domain-containing protein n=1 Tax=Niallia sp. NCCP-28 TaxID=2934712 RepID=UPI00208B2C40|nr:helix-turn-helix transcriptional regulator [Niallia sp. NCCP-28]GKU84583.1 hypothetical protein NCCP28_39790 [Niallia sp. NCCP-28]
MNTGESFTTEEIAEILKVSKLTVYDLIKKGELKAFRVGRQMRIDAADLEAFKKGSMEISKNAAEQMPTQIRVTNPQQNHIFDPFTKMKHRPIIISGQDNCLDILAKHIEQTSKSYRPLRSYIGSLNGLLAMYKGDADIVSTHLYDGETNSYNIPYVKKLLVSHSYIVIRFITRQAGLYVEKGNPKNIRTWSHLDRSDIKIVNREIGSGARVLLDEQLRINKINKNSVNGYQYECTSHYSVAAIITQGKADAGIGIERASHYSKGIDFIPLIKEDYDLVILKTEQNYELIKLLSILLNSQQLKEELQAIGYDVTSTGKIVYEQ